MTNVLNWLSSSGERLGVARVLTGAVVVGVILRVASAVLQGDHVTPLPGIYDQISYHALATRILAGHGFTFGEYWWPATRANQPTAQWSFLYTLYLAATYSVAGIHPLIPRLIQAVAAGILQPILTWRIGRRIFGQRVGLIAAVLTSVYAYFVYYAGALMTETFYILAILWALDLTLEIAGSDSAGDTNRARVYRRWFLLGLAFGVAVLLRQVMLFFVPLSFLVILISHWKKLIGDKLPLSGAVDRSVLAGLLVASITIAAMIAPFTVRNYLAFHQFVLLNTNEGYVFFWANNPIYGTSFIPILPSADYAALIPQNLRGLNEAALDHALLQLGIGFVVSNPVRYALLSLSRVKFYFQFWPSADSGLVENIARLLSFGVLLPFMIGGVFLSIRDRRLLRLDQQLGLALLLVFVGGYSLIHLLTWTLIRYRLPVDAVLVLFAAGAVDAALSWFNGWRSRPEYPRMLSVEFVTHSAEGQPAQSNNTGIGRVAKSYDAVRR